jgi:hypothetical protein
MFRGDAEPHRPEYIFRMGLLEAVKELAPLADLVWPTWCGAVARGGSLYAWNFSVTRRTVRMEADRRTRPNVILSLDMRLAPSLPYENSTGQNPCTVL